MKERLDEVIDRFLMKHRIEPGLIPVPVEIIRRKIQASSPNTPLTKTAIGRRFSRDFAKKQLWGSWDDFSGNTQHYFLNKKL